MRRRVWDGRYGHFEADGLEFERFRDVFTQVLEFAAAVGAGVFARRDRARLTRQMFRENPRRFGRCSGAFRLFRHDARELRIIRFELLNPQLQLLDLPRPLLALLAELHPA
jgi:hypothetical protein